MADHSQYSAILMQAEVTGVGYLKERWTEEEVLNLPDGEHDYFDRKSGKLFGDKHNLYETLAKALSAFANSGGGYLVLGQENDKSIGGVPPQEGRTPIREWLEQKVPTLLSYPLESFRVHTVTRSPVNSHIPSDKELVVIDVGDSRLAPHQAIFPADRPQYYYRQGGKSIAAPHHYIEALRNRLTGAVLESKLEDVSLSRVGLEEEKVVPGLPGTTIVEIRLRFSIKNMSRVVCQLWNLVVDTDDRAENRFIVDHESCAFIANRPTKELIAGPGNILIFPTRSVKKDVHLGFRLYDVVGMLQRVHKLSTISVTHFAISENHIGKESVDHLSKFVDVHSTFQELQRLLQEAFGAVPGRRGP